MAYFLVWGIKTALRGTTLPSPAEGDYEIEVIGKFKSGKLLAVMSPRGEHKSDLA